VSVVHRGADRRHDRARLRAPATTLAVVAALALGCASAVLSSAAAAPGASASAASADPMAARTRVAVNPDATTMVLLYFDLAGIDPPIDRWVEDDRRVQTARPADKAAQRNAVRAELEAAFAAVRNIGRLRLSVSNAGLSDYDPGYQEFTIGALSPGSQFDYKALSHGVTVQFVNGETAQHWSVPTAQAELVRDRTARGGTQLDVQLRIAGVQPGAGGGTILTSIQSYELRAPDGSTLVRAKVPQGG
jgi:hypothetical protein